MPIVISMFAVSFTHHLSLHIKLFLAKWIFAEKDGSLKKKEFALFPCHLCYNFFNVTDLDFR